MMPVIASGFFPPPGGRLAGQRDTRGVFWPNRLFLLCLCLVVSAGALVQGAVVLDAAVLARGVAGGNGSPGAVLRRDSGGVAVHMHCPFAGVRSEPRFFWDMPVRLDLRRSAGVLLDVMCANPLPVSQFNLYLRSGGVWHAAEFGITGAQQWQQVLLAKGEFSAEGISAGWGVVDCIRIAAWRGEDRDTTLALRSLQVLDPNVPAAILRSSSGSQQGGQSDSWIYSRNVSSGLARLGVFPALIDEPDVTPALLGACRVVLVPFFGAMSSSAVTAVKTYLEQGGAAVLFYELPAAVQAAAGLPSGRYYRRPSGQAALDALAFVPGALFGAPPRVHQSSSALVVPSGVPSACRVAARWSDVHGAVTELPAVILSSRAVWMTHVYLGKDTENGPRMLVAMLSRTLPEIWPMVVAHRLSRLESLLVRAGMARRAGAGLPLEPLPQGGGRRAWAASQAARRLAASGQYGEALDFADKAQRYVANSAMVSLPAPAGEVRGAWCRSWEGVGGLDWDGTARQAAACGLNVLFPDMVDGGSAAYPSRYLARRRGDRGSRDALADCLAACRRHKIQVHVWKRCFSLGEHGSEAGVAASRERLQVDSQGQVLPWLCPNRPENRDLELAVIRELVQSYPIQGVHLDFIRFPSSGSCVCSACRSAFEASVGRTLSPWPGILETDATLSGRWQAFRRETISGFVRAARQQIRQVAPSVMLSAAVFPNATLARATVGQDWGEWARLGLVDFVCPMSYRPHSGEFAADIARQQGVLRGSRARLLPGIGVSSQRLDPLAVAEQIMRTRAEGTGGFVLFEFGRREAREVLPGLREALF